MWIRGVVQHPPLNRTSLTYDEATGWRIFQSTQLKAMILARTIDAGVTLWLEWELLWG
ncbi:unnamed protein product [Rodentolepis nana]|uniref:Transposase n=1 Tax=Rodentolepis nana TaxID=102285 RepID=A0A0R3T4X6_RODNA|nr:unnamed protein product [Rodentolepis nana]